MVSRSPFGFSWDRFTFGHFHGFCKDILNEFGEKWPSESGGEEATFREIVPNKVLEVIKKGNYEKYDAIFIDEGQDYYIEWYSMLCHFLTNRDEVVVVCDKKQNIYSREMDWLDKKPLVVGKTVIHGEHKFKVLSCKEVVFDKDEQ
jgi:superfamily I DNA and RNA helicase